MKQYSDCHKWKVPLKALGTSLFAYVLNFIEYLLIGPEEDTQSTSTVFQSNTETDEQQTIGK